LLPNAINVNPKLSDNEDTHTYCGAVVALKLMCALIDEELFFDYCDLAAIATIADMVDLLGENRKIVKYGLQRINKQKNKNIKFLVDECVKNQKTIRVDDIAYFVAPAINASGRVDQADKCVELFTNNTEMPQETASILSNDNLNRRMIEKSTMQQVSSMIEDIDLSSIRGIILYKENWHPGVLGIVASKIKNKYFRPVILLTKNNDILVGSARSIEGVNMHDAIKYCKQYVSRFGGHFMAAGLSLNENDLNMFKRKFEEYLMNYDIELFFPKVLYDIDAKTEDLNDKFLQELELFEPFGKGNPSPTFLLEDVLIDNYKKMGNDNQHFRCKLDNSSNPISSVAFSNTMSISNLQKYRTIVSINKNEWNGRTSLQAQIKDIKPSIHKDVGNKDLEHAYDLSLSQGLYGSLDTVFEEIVIDQIKEKIQSSIFGKLLLVLDKDAEKKCLSLFDNEIDILDVRFETIEKEKINTNTILFAPDIQENDFSKYGEIYLLSSYDIKGCYKLLHDYNNVYIINNHNRGLNSKFTLDLKKLREIFVIIKSEIKSNKIDSFINGTKQYEKWEIRIALQIFSEVGLIKVQKRKPRYILTDIKKVKVENSITYITIQEGK
ncbi:MAG: hypothetical protein KAQ68_01495, partial [Clostridiales bacterium]|nr:hypothetical protein [Clostridiales bacterium]